MSPFFVSWGIALVKSQARSGSVYRESLWDVKAMSKGCHFSVALLRIGEVFRVPVARVLRGPLADAYLGHSGTSVALL